MCDHAAGWNQVRPVPRFADKPHYVSSDIWGIAVPRRNRGLALYWLIREVFDVGGRP